MAFTVERLIQWWDADKLASDTEMTDLRANCTRCNNEFPNREVTFGVPICYGCCTVSREQKTKQQSEVSLLVPAPSVPSLPNE